MLPSLIDSIDSQIHTIEWLSRNKKWSRIVVWCSCRVATTLTMLYVIDLLRFRTESIMYQSFFIFMMISIFAGSNDSMLRVGRSSIPRPKRETLKIELYHTFGPKRFGYVIDFSERFEIRYPSRLTSINKRLHIVLAKLIRKDHLQYGFTYFLVFRS